jgi:hypothetical protein
MERTFIIFIKTVYLPMKVVFMIEETDFNYTEAPKYKYIRNTDMAAVLNPVNEAKARTINEVLLPMYERLGQRHFNLERATAYLLFYHAIKEFKHLKVDKDFKTNMRNCEEFKLAKDFYQFYLDMAKEYKRPRQQE